MNITKIILLNAGLALAATSLAAQAPGPMGMGPGHPMGMGPGAACAGHGNPMAQLNLTDAQKTAMKAVRDRHQAALEAKGTAARAAHDAVRTAMADAAVDDAQIKTLHAKAAEAAADAMLERRAMMRECEALLTPEQKAVWAKARPQGGGMRGPMHGRGPGMKQGGCGFPG